MENLNDIRKKIYYIENKNVKVLLKTLGRGVNALISNEKML